MRCAELISIVVIIATWQVQWAEEARQEASRFAICFTGQLRTATEVGVQTNLARTLVEPLRADVFFVVSRRHEINHASGAGCLQANSGVCATSGRPERRGKWGSRRADATEAEHHKLRTGPLAAWIKDFRLVEDQDAIHEASRLDASQGNLVQKALRARCRLCLESIQAEEAKTAVPYDYVVRSRPDYAFDCIFPSASASLWTQLPRRWASAHRDYWEITTRQDADVLLRDLWSDAALRLDACRPYHGQVEAASRVESCAYFTLCAAGAVVRAADHYGPSSNAPRRNSTNITADRTPPPSPGTIIRPCCDDSATHKKIRRRPRALANLPTCDLDRDPVLGKWFLGGAAKFGQAEWSRLHTTLTDVLRPNCRELLPELIPPPPGDDDDDAGADDDDDVDDNPSSPAAASRTEEFSSNEELRRRRRRR